MSYLQFIYAFSDWFQIWPILRWQRQRSQSGNKISIKFQVDKYRRKFSRFRANKNYYFKIPYKYCRTKKYAVEYVMNIDQKKPEIFCTLMTSKYLIEFYFNWIYWSLYRGMCKIRNKIKYFRVWFDRFTSQSDEYFRVFNQWNLFSINEKRNKILMIRQRLF